MRERLLTQDRPLRPTPEDRQHARECPECRDCLEQVARLEGQLGTWVEVTLDLLPPVPPVSLPTNTTPAPSPASPIPWVPWAPILIGGAVLAMLGLGLALGPFRSLPSSGVASKTVQPASEPATPTLPVAPPVSPSSPPIVARLLDGAVSAGGADLGRMAVIPAGLGTLQAGHARLALGEAVVLEAWEGTFRLAADAVHLLAGTMLVRITRPGTAFRLETPQTAIAAMGTVFQVGVSPATGTLVEVFEGRVRVLTLARGEERQVAAGEHLLIGLSGTLGRRPAVPRPPAAALATPPSASLDAIGVDGATAAVKTSPEPGRLVKTASASAGGEPEEPGSAEPSEPSVDPGMGNPLDTLWTEPSDNVQPAESAGSAPSEDPPTRILPGRPATVGSSPASLLEGFQ